MLLTNMAEINELFVKNKRHRICGTNSMLCNDINIYTIKSVVMRMILLSLCYCSFQVRQIDNMILHRFQILYTNCDLLSLCVSNCRLCGIVSGVYRKVSPS